MCCLGITRSSTSFIHFNSIEKCIQEGKFIGKGFVFGKIFSISFSDTGNTKFVLDRINQAEKYLGTTCVQIGKVCRKEARLRDCNDQFVHHMFEFADREKINTSLRQSLQQYASYLSAVEDYRNALVSTSTFQ